MELVINKPVNESYQDLVRNAVSSLHAFVFPETIDESNAAKYFEFVEQVGFCKTVEDLREYVIRYLKPDESQELFKDYEYVIAHLSPNSNIKTINEGDSIVYIGDIKPELFPIFIKVDGVNKNYRSFMIRNSDRSANYISADAVISVDVYKKLLHLIRFGSERSVAISLVQKEKSVFNVLERAKLSRVRRVLEEVLMGKVASEYEKKIEYYMLLQESLIFKEIVLKFVRLNPFLRIRRLDPTISEKNVVIVNKEMTVWTRGIKIVRDKDTFYVQLPGSKVRSSKPIDLSDFIVIEESMFTKIEKMALSDTIETFNKVVKMFVEEFMGNRYSIETSWVAE